MERLRDERPGLRVVVRDVAADPTALARLHTLATESGAAPVGVPAFRVGDRLIVGFRGAATETEVHRLLDRAGPGTGDAVTLPLVGRLDAGRVGLPAFTIALGLVDGFNPCATWVLLFILSLLVNLHDRLRMLAIAGTFVLVSGLAYLAFMAAWLNVFLLLGASRLLEVVLGGIAAGVGGFNLKDALGVGRGPSLGIPAAARPGIYARVRRILYAEHLGGALAAAIVLAVVVNAVELLCTAGLPAVYTHVLARRALPGWTHYAYLVLYVACYMLDDAAVLAVAVVTLDRAKLGVRGGRALKLVSGLVLVGLGAALLVGAPGLS